MAYSKQEKTVINIQVLITTTDLLRASILFFYQPGANFFIWGLDIVISSVFMLSQCSTRVQEETNFGANFDT